MYDSISISQIVLFWSNIESNLISWVVNLQVGYHSLVQKMLTDVGGGYFFSFFIPLY